MVRLEVTSEQVCEARGRMRQIDWQIRYNKFRDKQNKFNINSFVALRTESLSATTFICITAG